MTLALSVTALPARAGDEVPGLGDTCEYLEIMAAEEMAKVEAVVGTEVLTRDC